MSCGHSVGRIIAAGLLLGLLVAGCSRAHRAQDIEGQDNISKLSQAYMEATNKLGKPPANLEQLRPHLQKHGDVNALTQPYVILWGVDHRTYEPLGELPPPVIAYERESRGGKRWVFAADGVYEMDANALANARFPPGHKPPS